jgi:acetolactate synthase-1/2/3 large subunit
MGSSPDWVKLAEAFGAKGMLIEDKSELLGGMKEALAEDGPVVCDVRVTPEENCYPMIPAGKAARDMVG